jgi:hypothetical protein
MLPTHYAQTATGDLSGLAQHYRLRNDVRSHALDSLRLEEETSSNVTTVAAIAEGHTKDGDYQERL